MDINKENSYNDLPKSRNEYGTFSEHAKPESFFNNNTYDYKRGDKVNFKGNYKYKPVNGTYIWADNVHLMTTYYIQHPDGDITKQKIKHNNGFPEGFESPESIYFKEGLTYICVTPEEIELAN